MVMSLMSLCGGGGCSSGVAVRASVVSQITALCRLFVFVVAGCGVYERKCLRRVGVVIAFTLE
jgi:hypothetical protein